MDKLEIRSCPGCGHSYLMEEWPDNNLIEIRCMGCGEVIGGIMYHRNLKDEDFYDKE